MLTYQNKTVKTSVRKLVEFLLRSGDIDSGTAVRADVEAMQEGSRLHRKIQKIQKSKKATYQSEVSLKMIFPCHHLQTGEDYDLVLEGRADGIDKIDIIEIIDEAGVQDEEKYKGLGEIGGQSGNQSCQEGCDKESECGSQSGENGSENSSDQGTFHNQLILIDEIKCVYRDVETIEKAEPLHLAQAKCYAYMYGREKNISHVAVRITYCNIETEDIRYIYEIISMDELGEWFAGLIDQYKTWADYVVEARDACRKSIGELCFPFEYRPGQKQMAGVIYKAIGEKEHLFLQAPTGIGKTISAFYPSIKQMGEGQCDTIFYLTAKTITRTVAEDTLSLLAKNKLRMHSVTITAKERICILDKPDCRPESCPRAKGHYDRINEAIYALLNQEERITREIVLEHAERHNVCPYQLAFEAAAFCECVICDYNYVFDPHVNVRGLFGETAKKSSVLLIDEAHNFPDRARSMYSADLRRDELTFLRKQFGGSASRSSRKSGKATREYRDTENISEISGEYVESEDFELVSNESGRANRRSKKSGKNGITENPYLLKKIQSVLRKLSSLERFEKEQDFGDVDGSEDANSAEVLNLQKVSDSLLFPLMRMLEPLEEYLKDCGESDEREEILQIYFRLRHFLMILEQNMKGYQVYSTGSKKNYVLHLYCVDPSYCLEEYLENARSAVFFSATLLPINYYRKLLGGQMNINAFSIPSPFDKKRRLLMLANDVTSRYSMRGEDQYQRIVRYLEQVVAEKEGNYMIFFPSYEMLSECEEIARNSKLLTATCDLLIQNPSMDEREREAFLEEFSRRRSGREKDSDEQATHKTHKTLIGFCVLGSLFSEGIDLTGDSLIGVLIVGTGLPKICKEREIIRSFFDDNGEKGYDYAYRYPGMNKVLQAAGRVIRTREDRGIILLMDDRFLWRENQMLLPLDWDSFYEVSLDNCQKLVKDFWRNL